MAAPALAGDEVADVLHALGGQAAPEVGGGSGLPARLAAAGLLGGGLGGGGRVGGGGQRGVGGVAAELGLQVADAGLQGRQAQAQVGDGLIALLASETGRSVHTPILRGPAPRRGAMRPNRVGGYPHSIPTGYARACLRVHGSAASGRLQVFLGLREGSSISSS